MEATLSYALIPNEGGMVQRVSTVAFEGIEARAVNVQVQVVPGLPNFLIAECECQRYWAAANSITRRLQWN
jgi:hypothetical protein